MSLLLSLVIVGPDRSHHEASSRGAGLIACCLVANDSPILGRLHQEKLILRLRRGRPVRTHPTLFFRPLHAQRPDALLNTNCGLTSHRTLPTSRRDRTSPAFLPPLISRPDLSFPASHLCCIRTPPQGTPFSFCFRACS